MAETLNEEEQRTAIRAFNHCYSQWIWNWAKIIRKQEGRAALIEHLKKHRDMLARAAGREAFFALGFEKVADYVEQNRTCPKTTKELDESDLMSVFGENEEKGCRLLSIPGTESDGD